MRSLGIHRLVLATGVAAAVAIALSGCSAGQVAETAVKKPSNPGVNADNSNRTVAVRNLSVVYPGEEGYDAGENAPLELGLFNQSTAPVTVTISSKPPAQQGEEAVTATQIGVAGGASPSASASASASASTPSGENEPSTPASPPSPSASASASGPAEPKQSFQPARIEIPAMSQVTFLPGDAGAPTAVDLSGKLTQGTAISLVFEFSNGAEPLEVLAPISTPLSPAPRGSAEVAGHEE
jgi:hypothetical protein